MVRRFCTDTTRLCELAEWLVEDDGSAEGFAVEERALGHGNAEPFLEAGGLGAELSFVPGGGFGFAAFVFDGAGAGGVNSTTSA